MTVEEWMKSREKQAIEAGMRKGIAKSILQLLEEQGTIPKQLSDEILAQTDAAVLTRWLKLAAKTTSIEEFMQEM